MKAIVLTYDRNRAITDHMIFMYQKLWPDNPFRFIVPYQELTATLKYGNVEYKKSPRAIKPTVLTLLEDCEDEEWVYWCADDHYPVILNLPRISQLYRWLGSTKDKTISGILFCNRGGAKSRELSNSASIIDTFGNRYSERMGYLWIWLPQFLRAKVLRHLFQTLPDDIPYARIMATYRRQVKKPLDHRLYVSDRGMAMVGESTFNGLITRNCYESMVKNSLPVPEWASEGVAKEVYKGKIERPYTFQAAQKLDSLVKGTGRYIQRAISWLGGKDN